MSDLTQFRDHARLMAARGHTPGCPPIRSKPSRAHRFDPTNVGWKWCGDDQHHDQHEWTSQSPFSEVAFEWTCHGICGGCVTPAEQELWKRLADEADEYLAEACDTTRAQPTLFEEA